MDVELAEGSFKYYCRQKFTGLIRVVISVPLLAIRDVLGGGILVNGSHLDCRLEYEIQFCG